MSPLPVLRHVLNAQRRSLAVWAVVVAVVAGLYASAYATVSGRTRDELVAGLPEPMVTALGLDAITTPGGYLASTVYGIIGPALLLVFVVTRAGRLLAGQEEDGTLELELTHPVGRGRVHRERLAAVLVMAAVLVAALTLAVLVASRFTGLDVPTANVLAGSAELLALVVAVGSVTFAAGASSGRLAVALGAGAGLGVAAYVAHALGAVLGWSWLVAVSPWSWYVGAQPLTAGFDEAGLLRLVGLAVLAAVVGGTVFARRDLG